MCKNETFIWEIKAPSFLILFVDIIKRKNQTKKIEKEKMKITKKIIRKRNNEYDHKK
jgi:hypothetical protein